MFIAKLCRLWSNLHRNSCIIFLGTNTSVKFVAKIAHLFRGQIDPLIIFGRDILNFIAGLAQWRSLAQTLIIALFLSFFRCTTFIFLSLRGIVSSGGKNIFRFLLFELVLRVFFAFIFWCFLNVIRCSKRMEILLYSVSFCLLK